MSPLGRGPRSALLAFHVLFAAAWMGGVATLLLLSIVNRTPATGEALSTVRASLRWVDWIIIIPSCLGSLATGFLFSWMTPWGFFRHVWIAIKWGLTVAMILFGIVCLGPWVDTTAALSEQHGLGALADPGYSVPFWRIVRYGALQIGLLVGMVFLSTFKPFGKIERRT